MVKLKTMLKKIIQFFKRYWIFIILAALASGLLLFRLNQRGQPTQPGPQPSPVPGISLTPLKIEGAVLPLKTKINLQDFSFPSRLKTYLGQESQSSSTQAKRIAQELGFSGSAQESEDVLLGVFLTWNSETHYLSISLETSKIDYGKNLGLTPVPKQGSLPSPETAKTNLENLLSRLGLKPSFELKWQKEEYLTEGYNLPSVSGPEQADYLKISANPAVGQYQLVGQDPTRPLISLILDKNKEIVRFQHQVYFSDFQGQETYDLKTKEEIENLLLSEGRIVYFGTYQTSVGPPDLTQAEFDQINLAYYQSPDKNLLIQPIYLLSGQGILENGETTEIITYQPAIKFGTQAPQNLEVPREFFQLPELP